MNATGNKTMQGVVEQNSARNLKDMDGFATVSIPFKFKYLFILLSGGKHSEN